MMQQLPGREEAIATGLLEPQEDGSVANRLARLDGVTLIPGQRVQVMADNPAVAALVSEDRLQLVSQLPRVDWWGAAGRILQTEPGEAKPYTMAPLPGSLRIVQGTGYDPGVAAFRTHTAINECSPHTSAFVRHLTPTNNPYDGPAQYDLKRDPAMVRALLLEADVVHCHIDALLTRNVGFTARPRAGQIIVKQYHGTQFDGENRIVPDAEQLPVKNAEADDRDDYVLAGARLQLCALRPGRIQWLPIPMPVARYAAMARRRNDGVFRIAHSPTRRRLKGTDVFLAVVERLKARGLPLDLVLIENVSHAESLRLRATADACFDSFALGIQGSGLESAAMGQPVIAGDARVRELYQAEVGYCPYTFAGSETELEAVIERLATDPVCYADEACRVGSYCRLYHDYAAVAERYDHILREAA